MRFNGFDHIRFSSIHGAGGTSQEGESIDGLTFTTGENKTTIIKSVPVHVKAKKSG